MKSCEIKLYTTFLWGTSTLKYTVIILNKLYRHNIRKKSHFLMGKTIRNRGSYIYDLNAERELL